MMTLEAVRAMTNGYKVFTVEGTCRSSTYDFRHVMSCQRQGDTAMLPKKHVRALAQGWGYAGNLRVEGVTVAHRTMTHQSKGP